MRSADVLLAIDAPFVDSPYLPSKVADYVGASKPLLALTPKAGELARLLGPDSGWVAHPDDADDIARALTRAVARVRDGTAALPPELREQFEPGRNAALFVEHCMRVVRTA